MRVIKGLPIIMLAISLGLAGISCDQLKKMKETISSSSGGSSPSGGGSSDCGQANYSCISGTVTLNGVGFSGVTVSLSDYGTATTTTDASGKYSFSNLKTSSTSAVNYDVTVAKTGYSFFYEGYTSFEGGTSIIFALPTAVTANFTASANGSISGTVTLNGVGLSGVTISLSGSGYATRTTDAGGNYSFSNLMTRLSTATYYYITPAKTGYTFSPSTSTVTFSSSGAQSTGVNFTAK